MPVATNQQKVQPPGQREPAHPPFALDESLLYRFYYQMYLIRKVEEQLRDLDAQGQLANGAHASVGQEACDVGVVNALDSRRDVIFSNYRAHGQFIVYTGDVVGLIGESMGKAIGVCGGVGGSQHLHKFNMYTNGACSGIAPNAVGAALAAKLKGTNAINVVFLGKETLHQGTVYESFNIAALWSLPVLFVLLVDAGDEYTSRQVKPGEQLASRADGFQIASRVITADDVFKVYAFASAAVAYVRGNQRPFVLTLQTGQEDVTAGTLETDKKKDPLWKIAEQLPAATRHRIETFVRAYMEEAVETAMRARSQSFEEFQQKWMAP